MLISRRAAQMMVLHFDRSGFCIWTKRLEAGRFVSDWRKVTARTLDWTGLKLLLEGTEPALSQQSGRRIPSRTQFTNALQ